MRTSSRTRGEFHRSNKWLRRARRLYAQFAYQKFLDGNADERNELVNAMAHQMIQGGLYATPPCYKPDADVAPRDQRHSITRKFCRIWQLRGGSVEKRQITAIDGGVYDVWDAWWAFREEFDLHNTDGWWFEAKKSERKEA